MNYQPKTGKERTIEILLNNRAMHKRRAKEWRQHAADEDEKARLIDLELRELGAPHEEDLEGRQLDLIEHISFLGRDSDCQQGAVGTTGTEFAKSQFKQPPE